MPISSAQAVQYFDRVDINDPLAVRYWADELNISHDHLRRLVATTGMMVDDIREELADRHRHSAATAHHAPARRASLGDLPS
ncbi:DUF3606 domain-containing protein [Dongia sp.]|uniref:DUF3606 domain-containing protein n=1 Tax=Dongia sp. TaxID=1977262 RepID=UPI0035B25D46